MDLLKLFQRAEPDEDPRTQIGPEDERGGDVATELHDLVIEQLARGGVIEDCVSLEMKRVGRSKDGRTVFAAMLRLTKWEQTSALRLLLGLPLLQSRIRRAVRSSWLHEVAQFSGLWLHPSGQFEEGGAMSDLRAMIVHLEQVSGFGPDKRQANAQQLSVWSVPPELADGADSDGRRT